MNRIGELFIKSSSHDNNKIDLHEHDVLRVRRTGSRAKGRRAGLCMYPAPRWVRKYSLS